MQQMTNVDQTPLPFAYKYTVTKVKSQWVRENKSFISMEYALQWMDLMMRSLILTVLMTT